MSEALKRHFKIPSIAVTIVSFLIINACDADVIVRLNDGRRLIANRIFLDEDDGRLMISQESRRIVITRRLSRNTIRSVTMNGRVFTVDELQVLLAGSETRRNSPRRSVVSVDKKQPTPATSRPVWTSMTVLNQPLEPRHSSRNIQGHVPHDRRLFSPERPISPASFPDADIGGVSFVDGPSPYFPHSFLMPEGRVIGVREGPLTGYLDLVNQYFPFGVPLSEVGYALHLVRSKRLQQAFSGPDFQQPVPESVPPPSPSPAPKNALPPKSSPSALKAIEVDARPISSGGKTDWDSLLVDIVGFDQFGRNTAVAGTVRVTLWGRQQYLIPQEGAFQNSIIRTVNGPIPRPGFALAAGKVEKLATWTRRVELGMPGGQAPSVLFSPLTRLTRVEHSGDRPVTMLVLPLPRPLPDHDYRHTASAELHVQLIVPGQGTVQATQRDILLRHRSELRNRTLVETGSPFFRGEMTSGGRQLTFPRTGSTSAFWPNRGFFPVEP